MDVICGTCRMGTSVKCDSSGRCYDFCLNCCKDVTNNCIKVVGEKERGMNLEKDIAAGVNGLDIIFSAETLTQVCHGLAYQAGWWTNLKTGEDTTKADNEMEKLMLIVTEVSEAVEGYRGDLMDDKLPHRKMIEVELADAVIRIFDMAGAKGYDLGSAIAEKLIYNSQREDHKIENRKKEGGKRV